MKVSRQRHIVFTIGRIHFKDKTCKTVYDYQEKAHFPFDGTIGDKEIAIYDYDTDVYLIGIYKHNVYGLVDQESKTNVSLRIKGLEFHGVDEESKTTFSGVIRDRAISFYDGETKQYFNYSV